MTEIVDALLENGSCLLFPPGKEGAVLEAASVAVREGRIVEVGPTPELAARYTPRQRVDVAGRLITPGFVDCHTHLVFAGDRSAEFVRRCQGASYEQIAAAGGGIRASVRATRAASEEELFRCSKPRLLRMLATGTTTVEIKSGYGLELETELRMLRVIRRLDVETPARVVATFLGAHEVPDEYRDDRDSFVTEVCEHMLPAVAESGLARFNDVFCEKGVFTPEESRRILETGSRLGLAAKIHADELHPSGGSRVAAEVTAVSADHLMKITAEDVTALSRAGVVPVLLPGTTFFLGKEDYAPARLLLDAGLPVALATDRNPGSSTIESMQFIIGLACLRLGMTPLEAFRGATDYGARALGLSDTCGRIEAGLAADLIVWETHGLDEIVYEFENRLPRTVYVGGKQVAMLDTGGSGSGGLEQSSSGGET